MFSMIPAIFGIVLFLYLTWRLLKEDYKEESLISFGWLALLMFLLGGRIVYGLIHWGVWNDSMMNWIDVWHNPGISFIGGYLSVAVMTYFFAQKNNWKVLAFGEDCSSIFIIMMIGFIFSEFFSHAYSIQYGIYIAILLITLLLAELYIKNKYRSFIWYKSGKKGFVFLFDNILFFLMLSIASYFLKYNIFISGFYLVISLISVVILFILGDVFNPLMINFKRKQI